MKLKTKKLIAREILFLFCAVLLSLILFLSVYPFNSFYRMKTNRFNDNIVSENKKADSLSFNYDSKIKQHEWFFEEVKKKADVNNTEYSSSENLWSILVSDYDKDTIYYLYENKWSDILISIINDAGFQNAEEFKNFIGKNRITEQDMQGKKNASLVGKEIVNLKSERNTIQGKIISPSEQYNFAYCSLIVILILLYPVRLLFIIFFWSLKTIKQKEA